MGGVDNRVRDRLRNSYWFIPSIMLVLSAGLAWATINIDQVSNPENLPVVGPFLYSGGTDGAREVLGTIASSMITVAGVVFSITIVSLQLASTQFGPRILANFVRDRTQQATLGTFVSGFLYSLLVLRVIRTDAPSSVPHLSVTVAVVLAVAGLSVLIYFIHRVATMIQAPNLVDSIADELRISMQSLFPDAEPVEGAAKTTDSLQLPDDFDASSRGIETRQVGYVQTIDLEHLLEVTREHDLVVRIDARPGRFLARRSCFARAYPAERVTGEVAARLADAVVTGARRTPQQDWEFPIRQLAEIAVRALSPAINDPFTASTCVEQAGAGLCELAARPFPSPNLVDEAGTLRIVVGDEVTWERLIGAAFDQVRQAASYHVPVYVHLLETLTRIAEAVGPADRLVAVESEARLVLDAAESNVPAEADLEGIRQRYDVLVGVAERRRAEGPAATTAGPAEQ